MGLGATVRFLWGHPVGRRRRWRTLGRYVAWQTLGRLRRGRVLDPWVGTSRLHVEHGMAGATGNLYVGLHEFAEMAFLLHLLRPGDLFADVGANVGAYTVLAAGAVGCEVDAFEPAPRALAALARNVRLNRAEDRVRIHRAAASSRRGVVAFTLDADTMNRVATAGERHRRDVHEVPSVPLDEALGGRAPLLVKIDVEGHEEAVLEGMSRTLAASALCAVIVEAWGEGLGAGGGAASGPGPVARRLAEAGFEAVGYDPWTRSLVAAPPRTGNQIWVRSRGRVEERLRAAPPIRVLGLTI